VRVLLVKSLSRYNALRVFVEELEQAMNARGIETVVADLALTKTDADDVALLTSFGPVDFGFTFSIYGDFVDPVSKRTIDQIIGAPMVVQLVDYPLSQSGRLAATAPSSAVLTIDPSHDDAIREVFGPNRFAFVGFNPHAALGAPHPPASSPAAFTAERPIALLFSGSGYAGGEPPWKDFPEFVRNLFDDAADLALSLEFIPALEAVDMVLSRLGADPEDPQFLPVRALANLTHEWVRSVRRRAVFETAAKVGLPLTICGSDDGDLFGRFECLGPVDTARSVELMQQARTVLNINANFGHGTHDRVFSAMVAGAAAVSDFSTYYAEKFTPGSDIALYRWTHLEEDLGALRDLIEDPVRLHAMAEAGHANACRNHRWDNRIDAILHAGEVCRRAWK
jgi:hypothetical protein